MTTEPNGESALLSKLKMIDQSIKGHESVLRCNYPHIDNERIRETVNFLWQSHYFTSKAYSFELAFKEPSLDSSI